MSYSFSWGSIKGKECFGLFSLNPLKAMMFGPVGSYDEYQGTGIKEGFGFDPSFRCEDVDGSYKVVKGFGVP